MVIPTERLTENRLLSEYIRSAFPASRRSKVMRRPVFGSGINDADYVTMPEIDGKRARCPAYRSWHNMIRRTHDAKFHAYSPTYSNVKICQEWLNFMTFRDWWLVNQVDNWHLDKDILSPGAKSYNPENCIFVPQWLNGFAGDCCARRGKWPIGVSWHQRDRKFMAHCKNSVTGKNEGVGSFCCPNLAHLAWKERKLEHARRLRAPMDIVDTRIYARIVAIIEAL